MYHNDDHVMYGSWDMECDEQNCLSFGAIFCPFSPLTTQKTKILKNWKKSPEISSFYTIAPKIMIICYTVPEIWSMTDVIFIFYYGLFFALLTPLTTWKIKIKKNDWRYHHFTLVYLKWWSHDVRFLRYDVQWMDRKSII